MRPGAVVLVAGPLDPEDLWTRSGDIVSGYDVVAPSSAAEGSPYAVTWIASVARALHAKTMRDPLVLVGHGSAGPLLPALSRTQRAAGRMVGGYVFVDAALPRPGTPSYLDLLRSADADTAEHAHEALHVAGATWPPGASRPQDHDFWTESLPTTPDWPDAPCAYVRTGAEPAGVGPTDFWARSARSRGWHVRNEGNIPASLAEVIEDLPG